MAADAEADFPVYFESAGGGQESEARRAEGVGRREVDTAVVEPVLVGGGGGA